MTKAYDEELDIFSLKSRQNLYYLYYYSLSFQKSQPRQLYKRKKWVSKKAISVYKCFQMIKLHTWVTEEDLLKRYRNNKRINKYGSL